MHIGEIVRDQGAQQNLFWTYDSVGYFWMSLVLLLTPEIISVVNEIVPPLVECKQTNIERQRERETERDRERERKKERIFSDAFWFYINSGNYFRC